MRAEQTRQKNQPREKDHYSQQSSHSFKPPFHTGSTWTSSYSAQEKPNSDPGAPYSATSHHQEISSSKP